jgi:twitching motility two-component system response regulator PilH
MHGVTLWIKKPPLVLIVEDSTVSSQMLQGILSKNGYTTHICADAESAREYLRSHSPDLILLDVIMPGMDGYEFSLSIRNEPRLKDTPIIF